MTILAPTGATGRNAFTNRQVDGITVNVWGIESACSDVLIDTWMTLGETMVHLNKPVGAGTVTSRSVNPMEVKGSVDIKGPLAITQFEKLLDAFHGQHYTPAAIETTAYTHSYWPIDTPTTGICTFAQHGGQGTTNTLCIDSAIINSMKITGKDGDSPLEIEFKGIGNRPKREPADGSVINTPTIINALTAPGQDAFEKKVTFMLASTVANQQSGYFKIKRIGSMSASTISITSPGGGNPTRGAVTLIAGAAPQYAPETITITMTAATTFGVTGSVSGAFSVSGTTLGAPTILSGGNLGLPASSITFTLTAGASPLVATDTITFQLQYIQTSDTAFSGTLNNFFPSGFSFSADRKMKGLPNPARTVSQPVPEGVADYKLEFDIPSYEGISNDPNSYNCVRNLWRDMQYQQAGTIFYYKVDCYFEFPQLAGSTTQHYYFRLSFPRIALDIKDWKMSSPSLLPVKMHCEVLKPFSIPTDFSGTPFTPGTTDLWPYFLTLCNQNSVSW